MKTKKNTTKIVAALLLCNQMLSPMMVFSESMSTDDKQSIGLLQEDIANQEQEQVGETEKFEDQNKSQNESEEVVVSDEIKDLSENIQENEKQTKSDNLTSKNYEDLDVAKATVTAIPRGNTGEDRTKERRWFEHSALETTGIFLPKGKEIKIIVDEEPENLQVAIGQYGEYENLETEEDYPYIRSYPLKKGENIISRPESDGMVYLENKSYNQKLSVTLEGGVEVPKYVLGKDDSAEEFSKMANKLKDKVPFFEIEGKYAFGTFQMSQLEYLDYENKDRLPELLTYWDQVVTWTNEVYGFNQEAGYAAAKNLDQRIHITNPDSGVGYASATSKRITFQIDTGASKHILSGLPNEDQWGLWHEIGHTYQNPYYKFEEMTEVTVNISANYIRQKVGMGDRTESRKNEIAAYLSKPREEKNYIEQNVFDKLAALWTLQRVFGDDFFPSLSQEYRTTPLSELSNSNSEEQIQSMIQIMSKVTNRNLAVYFDYWGLDASEKTWEYCNKLPDLEKDIWLDISGFEDRYELPGVLPEYTIPTGNEVTTSTPIFSTEFSISGLKSVPSESKVSIDTPQYTDIGVGKSVGVKVTNENKVSNLLLITGEITGGDAVKFRGNTSTYRIIAPDAATKTFSVIGNGSSFHSGGWPGTEYASITQYDNEMKKIKNQVSVNGSWEGSDSNVMQEAFDGQAYEIGDYVRIHHVESDTRLDRYKKDELLDKDNEKTYWYVMTKEGWQETTLDLDVIAKGGNFTLGQKVTPEELIELPKDSKLEIESITFKKAPDMSVVGDTSAEVLIKTTLGSEQVITVDNIKVTGGDAVKFRGNTSTYRIIAPDAATKTFSVIGNGSSFHSGGWPGTEYASITQYDNEMKKIKNQVSVNGSWEGSDSNVMQEAFDGQAYEIGDYVRIHHVESDTRLDRYKKDELLDKDNEKTYWYVMTKEGWQEVDISPKVLPVSNASITMAAPIRAAELVEVTPYGELTIEKIEVEKEPKYSDPGEIEVPVKVTDSLGQVATITVPVTVTGGDSVKLYGNYANATRHQIIAPDAKTRTFSVLGNGTNLHGSVTEEYVFIKHFDRSLNNIKNEVSINGSGDNSNSQMIKEKFNGKSYAIGDYVQIYHREAHVRLDRYIKDELQPKEQDRYYWYEMTANGWVPLAGEPEKGSVSVDGYQYGDINLTGTFSGDVKRGRLTINQKVVSWGGTFRDGQFTYYVGAGRIKEGDQAIIDFLNSEDEVVESYEIHPTSPSGKIYPTKYMLGDSEIRTTFEGDVKRARLVVDNVVVSVGGTILDGNILSYYVNPAQIKKDSNVVLQGYNSSDQPVGDPVKIDVNDFDGFLTTAEYELNSQWIKGTFEGNVKKAQLKIDDKVISSGGKFNSDGTFEYYVNPTQIKKDSQAYLTLYDGNGKLLEDKKYPVSLF